MACNMVCWALSAGWGYVMGCSKTAGIRGAILDSANAIGGLTAHVAAIAAIGRVMVGALRKGRKVLTAGNGGSAAEALHLAEELVGRYKLDRRALPAIALVADPTALTCIGNDYGFDQVFARQVEAHGQSGDILVLFTTSGRAMNLQLALRAAKRKGMVTVALLGGDGGALKGKAAHEILLSGIATARVQEAQQVILHLLLEMVDEAFA